MTSKSIKQDRTKGAKDWLNEFTPDQKLNDLTEVENTVMSGIRRWFASRILQPNIKYGWYNPETGDIVLGGGSAPPESGMAHTTVSAAALTLTCPANRRYKIYFAGCVNATQASASTGIPVIGGVTPTFALESALNSQTELNTVIPGAGSAVAVDPYAHYLWLNAGDTFTLTLGTYAAGNDTEHLILYEIYRV